MLKDHTLFLIHGWVHARVKVRTNSVAVLHGSNLTGSGNGALITADTIRTAATSPTSRNLPMESRITKMTNLSTFVGAVVLTVSLLRYVERAARAHCLSE